MRFDAVLFDVDGTVIDTTEAIINSLRKVLMKYTGVKHSDEELYVSMGITGKMTMDMFGVRESDEAIELWDKYFFELYDRVSFFPGIPEMLYGVRDMGCPMGLVTSKTKRELSAEKILSGILSGFDVVICSDDTRRPKPEPDPVLKTAESLGIEAGDALYVGDSLYDLMAARSAGMPFGVAMWGSKNPERLLELNPEYIFHDPKEIVDIIREDAVYGNY